MKCTRIVIAHRLSTIRRCDRLAKSFGTAVPQAQNAATTRETQTQEPAAQEAQPEDTSNRRDVALDSEEFHALEHEVYEANQLATS